MTSATNYVYEDLDGTHWPDAVVNTEEYYAIDVNNYLNSENDSITQVSWVVSSPEHCTVLDQGSSDTVAFIKLKPIRVGIYKITLIMNTKERNTTQGIRKKMLLKVIS